ncbi:MAG: DNA alkylation repair protein [Chloroflexota bacterium]|nr:DNA alkylation repair protein [Chloroflexota bacterium]
MTSDVSVRAQAWVEERQPEARGLGQQLAELIDDPEVFVSALRDGFERLADAAYAAEQERVAPGSGAVIGVRWPLVRSVARQLRAPLGDGSSASAISLAQRLVRSEIREIRLFAAVALEASMADDPERTWQVLRRLARAASDWISVDSMADLVARGIIAEPRRWAELEQLIYSSSRWERRLVGATLARMPFQVPSGQRGTLDGVRGLMLIESLIGDADEQVQKSLGWALREWTRVHPQGVTALLDAEATAAAREDDGHRAWVIRDALSAQPAAAARALRQRISGVRRRASAAGTSRASAVAGGFDLAPDSAERVVRQQGERMAGARA